MRTRVLTALVITGCLIAAGCGDDDDGGSESGGSTPVGEAEGPQNTDLTGDPVMFGTNISGVYPEVDQDWEAGVRAGIYRVETEGGIDGRPLDYEKCETQYDPNVASQCARDYLENDEILAGVSTQAGVPEFYETLAGGDEPMAAIEPGVNSGEFNAENVFSANNSAAQAFAAANACFHDLEKETLGAMYLDNSAGAGLVPAFNEAILPAFDSELLATIPVPVGAADVTPQAADLVSADPDCVLLALPDVDIITTVTALRQQGYEGEIMYTASSISDALLTERLGDEAEGLIAVGMFDYSVPAYEDFKSDMEAVYGDDAPNRMSDNALVAWLGVRLFAEAANAVSTLDRASIITELESMTDYTAYDLIGEAVDFSTQNTESFGGQVPNLRNTKLIVYRISDGQREPVTGEFIDAFVPES